MTFLNIIELILAILVGLGTVIASLGYFIGNFREGKNKQKLDEQQEKINTIDLLEKEVKILQDNVKELTNKVNELSKEVGEKDKKLQETLLILQGRDPKMEEFVTYGKVFRQDLEDYIKANKPLLETIKVEVLPIVKKLNKFLDKQSF